jgi:hypothetical protein
MSDENKGYNGWTNYETWNWKLWLDNEEGSYRHWTDRAAEVYADAVRDAPEADRDTWTDEAVSVLREELKRECDDAQEALGVPTAGPFADILNAALGEINWHEIARSYVEDSDQDDIEAEAREEVAEDADEE